MVITHNRSIGPAQDTLLAIGAAHPEASEGALAPDLAVAVIVPTYDDVDFLGAALESVRSQTHDLWRCYIVDDASPTSVESVVASFLRDDDRFVLVRHGQNAGLAAARNTGLRVSTEPLVQFLDADDMLTPWALERRVAAFRQEWDADEVAGVYGQIVQCPEEAKLSDLSTWDSKPAIGTKDWANSGGESPFNVHAPLVRRSVITALGGFDESFVNGAEDWELWQRIFRHGYMFRATSTVVGAYRQRTASMIRSHSGIHLARANELFENASRPAVVNELAVVSNGAMPVDRALGAQRRMERAAIFAGIATAQTGDFDVAVGTDILDFLDVDGTITTREGHLAKSARAGMIRGLGISHHNTKSLDQRAQDMLNNSAAEISRRLHAHVVENADHDRLIAVADEVVDASNIRRRDLAVIANSAADVYRLKQLADAAASSGLTVVAIDCGTLTGDQGVAAAWADHGIEVASYNSIALGAVRVRGAVIRKPAEPAILDLLGAAADWGALTAAVGDEQRELDVAESAVHDRNAAVGELGDDAIIAACSTGTEAPANPGLTGRCVDFGLLLPREELPHHPASRSALADLRNKHLGETCVIIGNGPSLNDTDLDLLRGVPTFGVNSIFLADARLPEPLTYYVVEDTAVFKDNADEIKAYHAKTKLFPTNYLRYFKGEEIPENTAFFRMNGGFYGRDTGTTFHPRFSTNAGQRVFCGQSVTIINLQLAYWMGFERVALIGMDFSYVIPEDAEVNGEIIVSRSDDPNHFHPGYFGAGKTWKNPHLDRVLVSYRLAGEMFAADGREVVNATVGGKLEVFDRMSLADALGK